MSNIQPSPTNSPLLISPSPIPPPTFFYTAISWNINGLKPSIKIRHLQRLIRNHHPHFILLQETHISPDNPHLLQKCFPNFTWVQSFQKWDTIPPSKGIAIGIRSSIFNLNDPHDLHFSNGSVSLSFHGPNNIAISIASIYIHPGISNPLYVLSNLNVSSPTTTFILAGDLNADPSDTKFQSISHWVSTNSLIIVSPPTPTHGRGRTIDHVIFPLWTNKDLSPYAIASPRINEDHSPIIFGCRCPSLPRHLPNPRLSLDTIHHPLFAPTLLKELMPYSSNPLQYIQHIHTTAWKVAKDLGRNRPFNPSIHQLSSLYFRLLNLTKWNLHRLYPSPTFKWLLLSLNFNFATLLPSDSSTRSTRGKILDGLYKIIIAKNASLPSKERAYLPDVKRPSIRISTPLVSSIHLNGIPINDPEESAKEIAQYWSNIFSIIRHHDPNTYTTLFHSRPNVTIPSTTAPDFPYHPEIIKKIITKPPKSVPGPDGIPFLIYKLCLPKVSNLWKDLIHLSATSGGLPPSFSDCIVTLIPKKPGPLSPSDFRPISITNAVYRIIGKYWSAVLRPSLDPIISPYQRALIPKRSITDCVELIHDNVVRSMSTGEKCILLQTDFAKAYDYINRDIVLLAIKLSNLPNNFSTYVRNILAPSQAHICWPGSPPITVLSASGVKQGCPVSPFLFILTSDPFVGNLSSIPGISAVSGYVDDVAAILKEVNALTPIAKLSDDYCLSTGSLMGFPKCALMPFNLSLSNSDVPPQWGNTPIVKKTDFLGVPISNDKSHNVWLKVSSDLMNRGHLISSLNCNLQTTCYLINTFMMSCIVYLSNFFKLGRKANNNILRAIRVALHRYYTIPFSLLFSKYSPLSLLIPIRCPILINVSMLISWTPKFSSNVLHKHTIQKNKAWAAAFYSSITTSLGIQIDTLCSNHLLSSWKLQNDCTIASSTYNHMAWCTHRPTLNPLLPWGNFAPMITANLSLVPFKDIRQSLSLFIFDVIVIRSGSQNSACSLCGFPLQRGHLWSSCEITKVILAQLLQAQLIPPDTQPMDLLLYRLTTQTNSILLSLIAVALKRTYNFFLSSSSADPIATFKNFGFSLFSTKIQPKVFFTPPSSSLNTFTNNFLISIITISHSDTGFGASRTSLFDPSVNNQCILTELTIEPFLSDLTLSLLNFAFFLSHNSLSPYPQRIAITSNIKEFSALFEDDASPPSFPPDFFLFSLIHHLTSNHHFFHLPLSGTRMSLEYRNVKSFVDRLISMPPGDERDSQIFASGFGSSHLPPFPKPFYKYPYPFFPASSLSPFVPISSTNPSAGSMRTLEFFFSSSHAPPLPLPPPPSEVAMYWSLFLPVRPHQKIHNTFILRSPFSVLFPRPRWRKVSLKRERPPPASSSPSFRIPNPPPPHNPISNLVFHPPPSQNWVFHPP